MPYFLKGQQLVHLSKMDQQSLPNILQKLKKEKAVSFLYEPETIAHVKITTPFDYNQEVKTILRKILPVVNLTFKKVGRKNYIIKKSKKKKFKRKTRINQKPTLGQKTINKKSSIRRLRGSILDEQKVPLIGATIYFPNNFKGTTTNEKGEFEIFLPEGTQKLEFSYTGYETQTVEISNQKNIQLQLKSSKNFLSEVVVSAIGFHLQKDKIGTTHSAVDAEKIQYSGEVSLLNSLGSKAANVYIARNNGDPGAASNIKIRGANTIKGASFPLVILDGIPIINSTIYGGGNGITGNRTGGVVQQNRLLDLNPNEIAEVQILKGASAAALWGSRAANGVLVISTKKGQDGQLKINYKSSLSLDYVSEKIPLQTEWGQGRYGQYDPKTAESWGDYLPDRSGEADKHFTAGAYFLATNGNKYFPIVEKNSKKTFTEENWNQVIQNGGFLQHDLSISGGNKRATFYFHLGRLDQNGIIKNAYYDRTNLRINNQLFVTDWLSIQNNLSYTHSNSNRIQQSSSTAALLLGLLRTPPDFNNEGYKGTYVNEGGQEFPNRHRSYRRYLGHQLNPIYNNPNWTVSEQKALTKVHRIIASSSINIQPSPWIKLVVRGGFDEAVDKRDYFFPIGSAGFRNPGVYAEDIIKEKQLNLDLIAKGKFKLATNIKGTATLGWNINDQKRAIQSSELKGFSSNSLKDLTSLNGPIIQTSIENSTRHIRSFRTYGILNTEFKDQLFLSLSGSLENASSISRTFFYPAVELAWQFSKNLNLSNILSFGKIRTSFGIVGIQPSPHRSRVLAEDQFRYSTYSDPLSVNLFGGGFRIDDDLGNPNLRPEIKREWEAGVDLRLLNNKLAFSFTHYRNQIKDILFYVKLTPSSGYDTKYANAGKISNHGIEADLNYNLLTKGDFKVNTFTNFGFNRNKVIELKGSESIDLTGSSLSSRAVVGYPIGVLFGTGSQLDENGNFVLNENGFPQLTPTPVVLGNPNPDWRGGLGFQINYKNWTFRTLLEHAQGGNYSPRTQWVLNRFGTTQETANRITLDQGLKNYAGELIAKGTTVRGNIKDFGGGPVLLDETWYRTGIGGGFGDTQAYNFSIKDATFTRLRELSLSYILDHSKLKQKAKISSIEFTLTGRNLFLWDHLPGVDPETNQIGVSNGFGLDYFTNPSTRSFLFSILAKY